MGSEEIQPFLNHLNAAPAIVDDQEDIFQCGKCKLQFCTLVDFLSHKREHAPQNIEQIQSQLVIQNEQVEMVSFAEAPDSNIWVWNNVTVTDSSDLVISTQHTNERNITVNEKCIDYETALNLDQVDKSSSKVYNANEGERNILQVSQKMHSQALTKPDPDVITCSECNRTFKQQFDLFQHFRTHTGEKPFQCIICGRTFSQKSNLKSHMLSHKVWPDSLSKILPLQNGNQFRGHSCPYCNKTLSSYPSLKTHLREHSNRKVFQCIQRKCLAKFADLDALLSHIKESHVVAEYHCHLCSFKINSLEEMSSHYHAHKNIISKNKKTKSNHTCIYCNTVFKRFQHLSHHLATASHINTCSFCNKTFVSERSLRCHLKLHDTTKNYRCDLCGVSFRRKNYLISHLLTHSKDKLHSCLICHKKFTRKDILMRHIKIHQDFQKKQCPFKSSLGCMMEFTRNDKLKLHIKSHTEKSLGKRKQRKIINDEGSSKEQSTIEIIIVPLISEQATVSAENAIVIK